MAVEAGRRGIARSAVPHGTRIITRLEEGACVVPQEHTGKVPGTLTLMDDQRWRELGSGGITRSPSEGQGNVTHSKLVTAQEVDHADSPIKLSTHFQEGDFICC